MATSVLKLQGATNKEGTYKLLIKTRIHISIHKIKLKMANNCPMMNFYKQVRMSEIKEKT